MQAYKDSAPNILIISTDQQHHRMSSHAGDLYVHTPHFDNFVKSAVEFRNAYTCNPVCVPCRYSWITGHMPHVFNGLEHNHKGNPALRPKIKDWIESPCMGHALQDAGYNCYYGGKMHVEGPSPYRKEDESTYGFNWLCEDAGDHLAEHCQDFLKKEHQKPFCLFASFLQPHDICKFLNREKVLPWAKNLAPTPLPENFKPSNNESEWMRAFRDGSLGTEDSCELGQNRYVGAAASKWDNETWELYRSVYRRCMEEVDSQIGLVFKALEKSAYHKNTIVIFVSDHGDHDGAHGLTMKRSFYEESVHVPFLIRDPSSTENGNKHKHLVSTGLDLMKTVLDYAGAPAHPSLKGQSLRPLLHKNSAINKREYVISQSVNSRMLRSENYKYMLLHHDDHSEEMLFDLQHDPQEMHNLAVHNDYNETCEQHRHHLRKWANEFSDQQALNYLASLDQKR